MLATSMKQIKKLFLCSMLGNEFVNSTVEWNRTTTVKVNTGVIGESFILSCVCSRECGRAFTMDYFACCV